LVSRFVVRCFLCDVCFHIRQDLCRVALVVCFLFRQKPCRVALVVCAAGFFACPPRHVLINTNPTLNIIPLARSKLLFSLTWIIFEPHNMVPTCRNQMLRRVTTRSHSEFSIFVYMLGQPVAKCLCRRADIVGDVLLRNNSVQLGVRVVGHCTVLYCTVLYCIVLYCIVLYLNRFARTYYMYLPPTAFKNILSYLHQPYDYEKHAVLRQLEERCGHASSCTLATIPCAMLDGPCRYIHVACRYRTQSHRCSACLCRRCKRDHHGLLR